VVLGGDDTAAIRILRERRPNQREDEPMSNQADDPVANLLKLPPLSAAQKLELEALRTMLDTDHDSGAVPPLTEALLKQAAGSPFYKPTKTATTLRIDSDVLAWLKAPGKGYQTRINAILRREMLASLKT
jgi:uncharacterized protein (DUF4415 family)